MEQLLVTAKYSEEDLLVIACPTVEQINILICYISLNAEQEAEKNLSRQSSVQSNWTVVKYFLFSITCKE